LLSACGHHDAPPVEHGVTLRVIAPGQGGQFVRAIVADARGDATFLTEAVVCRVRGAALTCRAVDDGAAATLAWPADDHEPLLLELGRDGAYTIRRAISGEVVREHVVIPGGAGDALAWGDGTMYVCAGLELLRMAPGAAPVSLGPTEGCAFTGRTLVDSTRAPDGTTRLRVREVTHDDLRELRTIDLGARVTEGRPCRSGDVLGVVIAEPGASRALVRLDLATGRAQESSALHDPDRAWCSGERVAAFEHGVDHLEGAICDAHGCASLREAAEPDTYQLHGALLAGGPIELAKELHRHALVVTPLVPRGPARRIPLTGPAVDLHDLAPLPHGALESTSDGVLVLDDRGDAVAP
jgi:hypothetical protein